MTRAATDGDAGLAARLRQHLGPRHPVAAVALVSPGGVVLASVGAGLDADFEIGSISKGLTGLLYRQACELGEIGAESTLGDLLPLQQGPAGPLRLAAVSRHESGLPRLPRSAQPLRRALRFLRTGENPYGEDLTELLAQARTVRLSSTRRRYSNFGFELLGHAVARGAGLDYATLLRERLTEPLGLTSMYAPTTPAELRPGALPGTSRSGRPRPPWTGEAVAPAGGIRSSITDLARLTQALLDGSAPGISALDPVAPIARRGVNIGAAWITLSVRGRSITWHDGATGGFRSWLGLDRAAGTGVVVLTATARSVDRHGFALLTELTDAHS
ncbi:serine hydrolase [Cryobacterium zongtaii]|uniref:Serine hydrolase n=1 Tax=Cryobacterium zongtaii TaxID=1259217 RepID=A0A2S3Z5Q6_9MICO|nr:serine hydrolase domain-containing protein [Cryobacterium zongtaii]POH59537.1 serine hydrolase [Cryobacterium zongtaii]